MDLLKHDISAIATIIQKTCQLLDKVELAQVSVVAGGNDASFCPLNATAVRRDSSKEQTRF